MLHALAIYYLIGLWYVWDGIGDYAEIVRTQGDKEVPEWMHITCSFIATVVVITVWPVVFFNAFRKWWKLRQ